MSLLGDWLEGKKQHILDSTLKKEEPPQSPWNRAVSTMLDGLITAVQQGRPDILNRTLDECLAIPWKARQSKMQNFRILIALESTITYNLQARLQPETTLRLLAESHTYFASATLYLAGIDAEESERQLREELHQARERIQQLEKHKADFLSIASHELRTPLTVIEGYVSMLHEFMSTEKHSRITQMLDGIDNGTGRLRQIIEDMIDIATMDMNLLNLNLQPVWMTRILDIATSEARRNAAKRDITIAYKRDTIPDISTTGDPERLHQVFQELLENAIKYTPDSGTVTVEGKLIGEQSIEVSIIDTGIGMSPADIRLIFDSFFSPADLDRHSTSKTRFKGAGSGLGLAIARGIIEAHGGTIRAESPGHNEVKCPGSTFYVTLPIIKNSFSETRIATREMQIHRPDDDKTESIHPKTPRQETYPVPSSPNAIPAESGEPAEAR